MRLRRALDEFVIDGIQTTIPLFRDLVNDPDIAAGQLRHPLAGEEARRDGRRAMTGRDDILLEITPQVLLKAYACRHLSDGRIGRGSRPLLDRAGSARHPAARPLSRPPPPGPHGAPARFSRSASTRDFEAVIDGCAAAAAGPRQDLDQRRASAGSMASCSTRPLPHGRGLAGRPTRRRPLRRPPRRRLLRRKHVQPRRATPRRSRSSIWSRGSRPAASACSTPSSPPSI